MKVTVTAKREFPESQGDGQSRRLVQPGEGLEMNLTDARKAFEAGKIEKFDEPERNQPAPRAAPVNKEEEK